MDISISSGKPILGKNHHIDVALLNILLSYEQIIHGSSHSYELEESTSFIVCWHYQTWNIFSHGSTDYHPLKTTTINDPSLVTLELIKYSTDFDLLVLSWLMILTQFLSNYLTTIGWRQLVLLLNLPSHCLLKASMPSLLPCDPRLI